MKRTKDEFGIKYPEAILNGAVRIEQIPKKRQELDGLIGYHILDPSALTENQMHELMKYVEKDGKRRVRKFWQEKRSAGTPTA